MDTLARRMEVLAVAGDPGLRGSPLPKTVRKGTGSRKPLGLLNRNDRTPLKRVKASSLLSTLTRELDRAGSATPPQSSTPVHRGLAPLSGRPVSCATGNASGRLQTPTTTKFAVFQVC
jgi:hypothetical protein